MKSIAYVSKQGGLEQISNAQLNTIGFQHTGCFLAFP